METASPPLTLNLEQALDLFRRTRMVEIDDIRAVDMDLLIVLNDGQHIVLTEGALLALTQPGLALVFRDGLLRMEQLFSQIETIELAPAGTNCAGLFSCDESGSEAGTEALPTTSPWELKPEITPPLL